MITKLIAIELDCETGIETTRPLTAEEQVQREQDMSRAEAERLAKETKEQVEAAERLALATWISSHPDLPEAARNALARATGVSTGAFAGTGGFSGTSVIPGVAPGIGVPNG